jgi:hypothetical protein
MAGQFLNLLDKKATMSQFADSETKKPLSLMEFQAQLSKYGITNVLFYQYYYSEDSADRNNILADAHVFPIMY